MPLGLTEDRWHKIPQHIFIHKYIYKPIHKKFTLWGAETVISTRNNQEYSLPWIIIPCRPTIIDQATLHSFNGHMKDTGLLSKSAFGSVVCQRNRLFIGIDCRSFKNNLIINPVVIKPSKVICQDSFTIQNHNEPFLRGSVVEYWEIYSTDYWPLLMALVLATNQIKHHFLCQQQNFIIFQEWICNNKFVFLTSLVARFPLSCRCPLTITPIIPIRIYKNW